MTLDEPTLSAYISKETTFTYLQKSPCKLCFFVCESLDVLLTGLKLCVGQAGLELGSHPLLPPKCCDCGHVPPQLAMIKFYVNISCLMDYK